MRRIGIWFFGIVILFRLILESLFDALLKSRHSSFSHAISIVAVFFSDVGSHRVRYKIADRSPCFYPCPDVGRGYVQEGDLAVEYGMAGWSFESLETVVINEPAGKIRRQYLIKAFHFVVRSRHDDKIAEQKKPLPFLPSLDKAEGVLAKDVIDVQFFSPRTEG